MLAHRSISSFTRSAVAQPSLRSSPIPLLDRPDYWRHAFTVLAGYGSALLPVAGWPGCVLSLAGVSGAGKTLAATLSVASHGQPKPRKSPSSIPSITVPRSPSAPILYDEITDLPPKEIARLIYSSADAQRITIVTSNRPILDLPQKFLTEGHRRRVVELYFPKAMPMDDGALLAERLRGNEGERRETKWNEGERRETKWNEGDRGKAGAARAGRRPKESPQTPASTLRSLQSTLLALRTAYPAIPGSYRFGLWLAAASLVGGRMARDAGLVGFDPEPVVSQVMSQMAADAWRTMPDPERARLAIRQWLDAGAEAPQGTKDRRAEGPRDSRVELPEDLAVSILRSHGLGFSALNSVAAPGRSPGMIVVDLDGEG